MIERMDTKTLLDLWNTRPVRRRSGKTIGGVCTGIAMRYRVDPTLVKVAFVVAAFFGGSGILLYLAALVALPAEDENAPRKLQWPAKSRHSGRHEIPWYAIVIAVIAVIALGNAGASPFWGSSGLLGVILMLLGWWLLYQRTPAAPAGTSADQLHTVGAQSDVQAAAGTSPLTPAGAPLPWTWPQPGTAAPTPPANPDTESIPPIPADAVSADAPAAPGVPTPPAWDPLGAAQFAWDLPEPTPPAPPVPVKPRRSPLTSVFAGLAVIVATAATAVHLVGGVEWFSVGRIAALALAVLGVGMLVDALQRRPANSRAAGLVPLALIVGVVAVVATLFAGGRPAFAGGGIGDRTWHPQGVEQLSTTYQLSIGTSTLDLRDLGPLDHDRTVEIRQGIGDVTVLLPDHLRVKTQCRTVVGDQTCPEGIVNPDAKTPTLTVKADLNLGTVEMKR